MKSVLYILATLFISNSVCAQTTSMYYGEDGGVPFEDFKKTTTYFVKTGDNDLDDKIIETMESSWTITEHDVIEQKDFKKKSADKLCSFVMFCDGSSNPEMKFLIILNGGRDTTKRVNPVEALAYSVLSMKGSELAISDCIFRVPNMVQSLQSTIEIMLEVKDPKKRPSDIIRNHCNEKAHLLKDRTLLLCAETMSTELYRKKIVSEEELAKYYPYEVRFCTKKELTEVIESKSTEYYYLQPVISITQKYIQIVDPSNGEIIYLSEDTPGRMVDKDDIIILSKLIKSGK